MPKADTPLPLCPEVESLESSKIVELWQLGFGRADLVPLWVGEGDVPTPDFICRAASDALAAGKTFYTHKRGLPELRAALADYHKAIHAAELSDDRISVTSAGMNAIQIAFQSILRSGDELVAVTPVWPNALAAARAHGGRVVEVGLEATAAGGFALDLDRLADACGPATRAIFLASPSNPTGWTASRRELQAILDLCRARGIWLIADEVYHRFLYDDPEARSAPSILELAEPEDPVLVINSFSKAWAMTGWRLGWLIHPASMEPAVDALIEFNTSGAPPFLQEGALAAVRDGEPVVDEMVERGRQGADLVTQRLGGMRKVTLARPPGAFYAFFAVEGMTDSLATAKDILERTGVGLAPGIAFGPAGEGFLRLCFASSQARLSTAMDRLATLFD